VGLAGAHLLGDLVQALRGGGQLVGVFERSRERFAGSLGFLGGGLLVGGEAAFEGVEVGDAVLELTNERERVVS
jgi:hypothetical protein